MQPEQRLMYPGQLNDGLRAVNTREVFNHSPFGSYAHTTREFFTPTFNFLNSRWDKSGRPSGTERRLELFDSQGERLFTIKRRFTYREVPKRFEISDLFTLEEKGEGFFGENLKNKTYNFQFKTYPDGTIIEPHELPQKAEYRFDKKDVRGYQEAYMEALVAAFEEAKKQTGSKVIISSHPIFTSDGRVWNKTQRSPVA